MPNISISEATRDGYRYLRAARIASLKAESEPDSTPPTQPPEGDEQGGEPSE